MSGVQVAVKTCYSEIMDENYIKCPNVCCNGKVLVVSSERALHHLKDCGACGGKGVIRARDVERVEAWINYGIDKVRGCK